MLFNSYLFIFIFLPITLTIYFFLNKKHLLIFAKGWLIAGSLFFYSWWNISYLPILIGSILFNYLLGTSLCDFKSHKKSIITKKLLLILGITVNLGLLGYFKYSNFFIENVNQIFVMDISLLHLALPLGISFFTFTQIAYLVDAYKSEVKEKDYLNYSLFVTFFPHLICGPIIHHKEMMPQFDNLRNKIINYKNLFYGLNLFTIGLFKKVVLADTFAVLANTGFDMAQTLTFIQGWATSLSYSLQLYYDFSGYTDMALGIALMFNIVLPINFNSPYKALSVQDFWRRWHITLSRFLKNYVYIPLGGNRKGELLTYRNLMLTFLLGGLWHGAGWTFIFWGFLHGSALIIERIWKKFNIKLNKYICWFLTFNFINVTWIFFRAKNWKDATKVLSAMTNIGDMQCDRFIYNIQMLNSSRQYYLNAVCILIIFISCFYVIISQKNSNDILTFVKPNLRTVIIFAFIFVICLFHLNNTTQFLYFDF